MHSSEIEYFKLMLINSKKEISKNIMISQNEMLQLREMDFNDECDYASARADDMVESAIRVQQNKELLEIEEAIDRIDKKTYGKCLSCDDDIGYQRLKVKPHAKYCIECRKELERHNNV